MCSPGKTEVIHLSSRHRDCELIKEIWVGDTSITPAPAARDLGVTVDSKLQLDKLVNNICKSASFAIKNIGRIRTFLSHFSHFCERIVHAFITSNLDYCNAILLLFSKPQLKLQRVQNTRQDW